MATPAREKIAGLLTDEEPTGSFSVETRLPAEGVTLTVDGVGAVRLPVGAPQKRALTSVARPAMFGLGEQTLTDTSVRDTWELTADQVSLGGTWDQVLDAALADVHEGLGLPRNARLRAELHALLVYGPDQFFAPHRDSEKDDEMVATLVVTLPSIHTGGALVVNHGDQTRVYRHSARDQIGFAAFYADCLHEVKPVRSGRRVTLTFNLLVTHDSEEAEVDPDDELAALIDEHFSTPATRRWSGRELPPPNRLVVLLDHQYSERGLAAGRLKGRDVEIVGRLRAAAKRADCQSAFALAEIRQTWSAYLDNPWGGADEVNELIDDETALGWWYRDGADVGEPINLIVDESQTCEVTSTASLTPYDSEYEGYMGNYGNTLDRWYRRAALVLWPTSRDFIARAEADLPGAVAELQARLASGDDLDRARADARELVGLIGRGDLSLLPGLLSVSDAVDDADIATSLLTRLGGEGLTSESAVLLAETAARYGDVWTRRLIEAWFPVGRYRSGRWAWPSDVLPGVALRLRQAGAGGVADDLCRRVWTDASVSIVRALALGPRARAASLTDLLPTVEAILTAADDPVADEIIDALSTYDDGVLDLELPLLRRLGGDALRPLAEDAARRLEAWLATPPRRADDWSIRWSGCGCELCDTLQGFLGDDEATELDWPLRADRRQHIHQSIDSAELPVDHHTIRKGSPYTLRLVKRRDLHDREAERRRDAEAGLAWLREM
ncbi:MAG: 2OG-Fe(II) oxygenase [Aeromicrobium sp.]|uniref:2OG-Fe(II) oxygenase n=1 Tax=Aeromicrobium sp. TaxID=1871063 RepID=UPI0039E64070